MLRLVRYELSKTWSRRGTLALLACVLAIFCFSLWYTNLPNEYEPPLGAYKALQSDLDGMTDSERLDYLEELDERLENIEFVRDILHMQSMSDSHWREYAESELERRPGVFEEYLPLYNSGEYLVYTGSFEQERALIGEAYSQAGTVAGYDE